MHKQVDVVVVGAGPVGLLLAIELKLGGAGVIVLERLTAPNLGIKAPSVGPLGAEVRGGCEVTSFEQHAEGVEVGWTSPSGPDHARCSWLVGCDGGRSPIRKMAGFAFTGAPPSLTMYQCVLDLDHPERLPRGL